MAAEPSDFVEIGEVIGGYRLERILGAGSTSHVYLGKHVVLGRKAAIKVLVHKLIGNEDVISRLLTEAKVVNDIKHPNIIDISDFINTSTPRRVALVMEYIEGPSLTICREHPLTFEQAVGAMLQVVAAVRAAHAAGIIHRDIKPDNLLLTTDPRHNAKEVPGLKVVDFGIAKMAHSNLAQTAVGTMLGTPAYMAPEQIAGRPRPSAATDVFAIGEVLYEVLTSKRAYPAGTISETVRSKLRGEIPDLKLPPMPGDKKLIEIIRRCLSYRPEDRPGLQEIHNVLESVRPGGERIRTIDDLEDMDDSEIDTRMARHNPVPPAATTELSPMSLADPTPFGGVSPPARMEEQAPTVASPLPRFRRMPKETTSPTNRVLPALTEIASFADRPQRKAHEMPNAATIPGTLTRKDLNLGAARVVRDEQSLAIGELRIGVQGPRFSDDESSVQLSDAELSQLHAAPSALVFDDDPLRITPQLPPKAISETLDPVGDESSLGADIPLAGHSQDALPALGLSQPAGLGAFDQETDLDGMSGLDAGDLEDELDDLTPMRGFDAAATMPPKTPAIPTPPPVQSRRESGPEMPDTRITHVGVPKEQPATNRLFIILLVVIGLGTVAAILIATGRIHLGGPAPMTPPPAPPAKEAVAPPPAPAAPAEIGMVRIESEPTNADVMHVSEDPDSEPLPLGKTPLSFQLTGGGRWPQHLRIVHPDYEPVDVEVTPENSQISVKLRRK